MKIQYRLVLVLLLPLALFVRVDRAEAGWYWYDRGVSQLGSWARGHNNGNLVQYLENKKINQFGVCRSVLNNNRNGQYYVPVKSKLEWCKFINNPPSGVTTEACVSRQRFQWHCTNGAWKSKFKDELQLYNSGDCTDVIASVRSAPRLPPQCSDGVDNDGNGLIDMADTAGCTSPEDDEEVFDYTGSVICTELNRQGLLRDDWMQADAHFGARMPRVVITGYHAWAKPVVRAMQGSEKVTKVVNAIAQPWAKEMAHIEGVEEKGSITGKILMVIGIPVSAVVGVVVSVVDWIIALLS